MSRKYYFRLKYKLLNPINIVMGLVMIMVFSPILYVYRTPKKSINYLDLIAIYIIVNIVLIIINYVLFKHIKTVIIDLEEKELTLEFSNMFKVTTTKYYFSEISYKCEYNKNKNSITLFYGNNKIIEVSDDEFDLADIWDIERLLKNNVKKLNN